MVKEATIRSLSEKMRKDAKLNKKLDRTIRAFANNRKLNRRCLNELKEVYFKTLEREENCSSIPDYDEYQALYELFSACLTRFSKSDETSLILIDRAREVYFGKCFFSKKQNSLTSKEQSKSLLGLILLVKKLLRKCSAIGER